MYRKRQLLVVGGILKMRIHSYFEMYLKHAQTMLGDAFDYAINTCHISGDDFVNMFVVSSMSKRIENGEPACVAGKSGIELVHEIVFVTMQKELDVEPEVNYSRSCEYWIGWAVAYYQWYSDRSFKEIFRVLSFEDLKRMYYTLHEADISKFVDIVDSKMKEYYVETNLKRIRTTYGYTQQELSDLSGVSLRSIQLYEQRNKDINKASVDKLYRISKVFGCKIEDLIEK